MQPRFVSPIGVVVLEDGGSRLLIGPSHLMVGLTGLNRVWDREQARALLRRYVNEGWEMSALRQLAADHGIGQRQSIPDGNFLDLMAGQTTSWPFVMIQLPSPLDIASELAGMPSGAGGDDGSLNPAIYINLPVTAWTLAQKLHFVVNEALPLVGPEVRKQLEALLDPTAILWTVGIIAGMIAATAAGVGAVFALAVSALAFAALGWAAVDFIRKLGEFLDNTVGAQSKEELRAASAALAAAAAIGGVALIRALLRRGYKATAKPKSETPPASSTDKTVQAKEKKAAAGAQPSPPGLLKPKKPGVREPLVAESTPDLRKLTAQRMARANGKDLAHVDAKGNAWPQLAADQAATFRADPLPERLAPGTKLYRVIGDGSNPAGHFWSLEPPPASEGIFRSGYAVKNDWSGASAYVTATVPKGGVPVWRGITGPQTASKGPGYLPGGKEQLWLDATHLDISKPTPTPWNR